MSTIYRLQFLLIAAAAILATAFPANAQTTLEAVKQKGVLVAGSSAEYPPFEYVADGKLVGYDVDMAEEITRRMGVKVAWEKIDFKGIVAALTAKRVDVLITALTWTPERAALAYIAGLEQFTSKGGDPSHVAPAVSGQRQHTGDCGMLHSG